MLERRKGKRRSSVYYLEVFEEETKNFVGRLIDITRDGMMLESQKPIEVKKRYRLSMQLPTSFIRKQKLTFDAKSVWCKKEDDFESYKAGFQLQNLDTKREKEISKLMKEFKF